MEPVRTDTTSTDAIGALTAQLGELRRRADRDRAEAERAIAELSAAVDDLRADAGRCGGGATPGAPPDGEVVATRDTGRGSSDTVAGRRPMGRREALRAAGVVAAGAAVTGGGMLGGASPAAAADGSALVLGSATNSATSETGLTVTSAAFRPYGLGVTDNGLAAFGGRAALLGHAKNVAFTQAVVGVAEGGTTAIRGQSGTGFGGHFLSAGTAVVAYGRTAIELVPQSALSPTEDSVAGLRGAVRAQALSANRTTLWACVQTGNPGQWRVLAGPATAGALHVLPTPVRIYDSRAGTLPAIGSKTPLAANQVRTLDLTANSSGVPAGATAAVLSILLVNAASGSGNVTVWAGGASRPQANTMVWGGSAGRFSTTALTAVDAAARVQVSASLRTDLVVDVVAYHR